MLPSTCGARSKTPGVAPWKEEPIAPLICTPGRDAVGEGHRRIRVPIEEAGRLTDAVVAVGLEPLYTIFGQNVHVLLLYLPTKHETMIST